MTATFPDWVLIVIAALCGLVGVFVCSAAALARDPGPGETAQPARRPASSQLPRSGSLLLEDPDPLGAALARRPADPFETPPLGFESVHHATMDAHNREISEMLAAYPYPPHE